MPMHNLNQIFNIFLHTKTHHFFPPKQEQKFNSIAEKCKLNCTNSNPFECSMACALSNSPTILTSSNYAKLNQPKRFLPTKICSSLLHNNNQKPLKSKSFFTFQDFTHLGHHKTKKKAYSDDFFVKIEKNEAPLLVCDENPKPVKFILWVLFWASLSLGVFAFSKDANAASNAAVDSIKASSFGVKVASGLRGLGWADEAVVFALATLPVIELRGAIPVGYWLQLNPVILTVLSVLGNMVPVPFIVLYLKKFATFVARKNQSASRLLDMLFERAKAKAGPVEEFQWLGLMLFVAVPFPGTGAWTGAIIASILDMPFWSAVTSNFVGVVLAGLLVNLLVNLGLKYAIVTAIFLFVISTFMWSILRSLKTSLRSTSWNKR